MSTNYYAKLERSESDMTVHLGKTGAEFVCLSGVLFDSWADMKKFLERNAFYGLRIEDEYGVPRTVSDFVDKIEAYHQADRERQYKFSLQSSWLDTDGFTMSGYDFT